MDVVGIVDNAAIRFFAQIARHNAAIDFLISKLVSVDLLKGAVAVAVLWAVWFGSAPDPWRNRETVLKTILAGLLAAGISRAVQNFLPHRPRPMHAAPDFIPPGGIGPEQIEWMRSWSSFPSDHAALFFALAAGIWPVNRRLSAGLFAWTAIVICVPRVYLGLHYVSDILGGLVLGAALAIAVRSIPDRALAPVRRIEMKRPAAFYAMALVMSYEMAQLFADLRTIGSEVIRAARLMTAAS